jgi:TetR/AcrR family tetracycline transcriptional repressor
MILSLGDFVLGSALEYQAEVKRRRVQNPEAQKEIWAKMEAYPNLYSAATARAKAISEDRRDSFDYGLSLMISGIKQRLAEIKANKKAEDTEPSASS